METNKKPELLILADNEMVCGARKGYYREFENSIQSGDLDFITEDEACEKKRNNELVGNITTKPEEGQVFVFNPYKQQYLALADNNIEEGFINAKAVAYKRALMNMGAHCVILEEDIHGMSERDINAKGKIGVGKVEIDVKKNDSKKVNLQSKLCELNLENKPKNIEVVKKQLQDTTLMNDDVLRDLFEELKEEGCLKSTATIEIKFVSELQSALDIAGKIDFGPIGGEIGVSIKEKNIHEMTKSIKIYFGDVPNEVQDKFKSI